jgi:hypothetical protein
MELIDIKEEKKFINSWKLDDYQVLSENDKFVDIEYLHETIPYEMWEIVTEGGKSLKCADDHIVFLENHIQIFTKDLKKGDVIIVKNGLDVVESVKNLFSEKNMFDLELVENSDHRFFTNEILSHNTHVSKQIAKHIFDNPEAIIRVDMSEYAEKFNVSKLIGSPPGYVGYEKGGQLTEKVRRRPYSVVLLDEIEKAHPEIFNTFLPVFDEGYLTDSLGRKISFKNTIIIMTTNLGVKEMIQRGEGLGFSTKTNEQSEADKKEFLKNKLKKELSPELLNRVDDIIVFNTLEKENIKQIVNLCLKDLKVRCLEQGFELELTEAAKEFLADKGYDKEFGARPLDRAIATYVEDPLSLALLKKEIQGKKVLVDYETGASELKINYSADTTLVA